ncbi:NfeD family protein [Bdellovibrionota bacterium FG-1]
MNELVGKFHWVWLALALIFAMLEIMATSFGFIFAAVAALFATIAAALGAGWDLQLGLFGVTLVVLLLALRPAILRKLRATSEGVPSRTSALLGLLGQVTEAPEAASGLGRAQVDGQDWAIRCHEKIEIGTLIRVEGADGIILIVKKA